MAFRREIHERYRLGPRLGGGARTSVHAAAELTTGANLVVKRIAPGGDPLDGQNFLRFGAALASLRTPGLPSLHDFGLTPDGGAFLVLEPLAGRRVTELIEGSPGEILPVLLQIVDALEQLADRAVAYGNLSPENVLLAPSGSGEQIKLLGLGTALLHAPVAGDPEAEFAAPEQIEGGTIDHRCDVYSFGRLACRLLGIGIGSVIDRRIELHLPLAVSFELEDAEALRLSLVRCLAVAPEERPSWREIRESLRTALRGPAAQPSLGDKTNPVYIPPDALGGGGPSALRFEEVTADPPVPVPPAEAEPEIAPEPLPESSVPDALAAPPTTPPSQTAQTPPPSVVPPARTAVEAPPEPPAASGGDVLPALEELLAAPEPVVAGALIPPAPGTAVAPPPPPRPIRAPGHRRRLLTTLGFVGGGILVLALLFVWLRDREGEEFPGPLPPPADLSAPPPTVPEPLPIEEEPAPSLDSNLIAARTALEAGDDAAARRALAAITPEVAATLSPEEIEERRLLEEALGQTKSERWIADLRRALRSGNAALLRSSVRGLESEPALIRTTPGLRADLAKAREAIELFDRLQRANRAGDSLATVEVAGALQVLFPRDKTTPRTRERAAAAIETEADRLAQSGDPNGAISRLEALANAWPERDGVTERVARLRAAAEVDERLERVLANAAAAERRRRPDEALRLLRSVEPSPPYATRFREASERAESEFRRLDQSPPTLALRQGSAVEYEKGATTRVALEVGDDFQIAKVALFARIEGGAWQQMEVRSNGNIYSAEIAPGFHQNKDIQWYATASDLSGHTTELGSAQSPRALRRKKWFDRLRGGKEGDGG